MVTKGLLVRLEAKAGHEGDVERSSRASCP